MKKCYYIYILASQRNGSLYIGVTANLIERIRTHKMQLTKGFTEKYHVDKLVHVEEYDDIGVAIEREKRLKEWSRKWKIRLIEKNNPYWQDLYDAIAWD